MQSWSTFVTLFVLASGIASYGCSGDDPAPAAPGQAGGETRNEGPAPVAPSADGQKTPPPAESAPPPPSDAGSDPSARILAYAFSHDPSSEASTPGALYAYNAAGGAMAVTRTSTGQYVVKFAGLAGDGTVALVSAYDTLGGVCAWGGTSGDAVTVRCYSAGGSYVDAKFVVTVVGKGTAGATILGFSHAHDMTSDSYSPQAARSKNGAGGDITATRSAAGTYQIEFAGLGLTQIGNVQVTPYGSKDARCVVKSWLSTTVNVRCYDGAGALADAQYDVLLAGTTGTAAGEVVAYAHANESASPSYSPALAASEGGGGVTALRSAAGTYTTVLDGKNLNAGAHVQVTAQGQGRRCNVQAWAGSNVDLTCANSAGTLLDNNYAVVVVQ